MICHHLYKEFKPSHSPSFKQSTWQEKGLPSGTGWPTSLSPMRAPISPHGRCRSHTDSQGCTVPGQSKNHGGRLVVGPWRGGGVMHKPSLWCRELLCPPWARGRGSCRQPPASFGAGPRSASLPRSPPRLVPPREASPFRPSSSFGQSPASWKYTGAGSSSVISQGVLEVLYQSCLVAAPDGRVGFERTRQ